MAGGRPRGIIDSWKLGGPIAAQHPPFLSDEGGLTLAERAGLHFVRVRGRRDGDNEGGQRIWDRFGDWLGLAYWVPATRPHGAWANAWPAIVTKVDDDDPPSPAKVFAKPIFDDDFEADDAFGEMEVFVPIGTTASVGQILMVLDSTNPEEQQLLGLQIGDRLISDHRSEEPVGPFNSSTFVHDEMPDGTVDPDIKAALHTFWRVSAALPKFGDDAFDPDDPGPPPYGLAWSWIPTPRDIGGGWVFALDSGSEEAAPAPALGRMWYTGGGPFMIPPPFADGDVTMFDDLPAHGMRINTDTARYTNPATFFDFGIDAADGPKEYIYGADWEAGATTAYVMRVEHRFDPGSKEWKWQSWSYKQAVMEDEESASPGGGPLRPRQAAGAFMHNELGVPSVAWRAQPAWLEHRDLRYAKLGDFIAPSPRDFDDPEEFLDALDAFDRQVELAAEALEFYERSPIVALVQAGGQFVDDEPVYGEDFQNTDGRNFSGSGRGFLGLTPGARGLKEYRKGAEVDPDVVLSQTGFALFDAILAFAHSWDPELGDPCDGWHVQLEANGDLSFLPVDLNCAPAPGRAIAILGRLLRSALVWNVRPVVVSSSAAFGDAIELAGAGITITLPEILADDIGKEVLVSNEGNNQATIVGFNGTEGIHSAATSGAIKKGETFVLRARSLTQWRLS